MKGPIKRKIAKHTSKNKSESVLNTQIILRKEINCMIECYMKEMFKIFGKKEVIGIYLLGSVNKKWDSEIDYIPSMSDVDLNVYIKHPDKVNTYFSDITQALSFAAACENNFRKIIKNPIHIPRLQAQLHNMFLDKYPDYLAPKNSVKTIYGVPYENTIPETKKKAQDHKKKILDNSDFLRGIPLRIMSANNERLIRYLSEIYYRVCTAVPHILCLKGMTPDDAMCLNKTTITKNLESFGYKVLAKKYLSMLKNCYKCGLNSYRYDLNREHDNSDALYSAISEGYNSLKICIQIAEKN